MDSPLARDDDGWALRLARARFAWICLGVLGMAWALFSWRLHSEGIAARAVVLPIEPADYYRVQAFFVGPLLVAAAALFTALAWALSGARRVAPFGEAFQLLALSWAVPVLVLFVIPDLAVYTFAGHAALAPAMRIYGPLAPLAIVVTSTLALRDAYQVPAGRGVASTFAALVVQTVVCAIALR